MRKNNQKYRRWKYIQKCQRPVKIGRMVKSLRTLKIRQMVKSLRPLKIRRMVKSWHPVKIRRMVKSLRLSKSLRLVKYGHPWECCRSRKSRRPAEELLTVWARQNLQLLTSLWSCWWARSSPRWCVDSRTCSLQVRGELSPLCFYGRTLFCTVLAACTQGCGSGSGSVLDPYSIGSLDPDPDPY